MKSNEPEEWTNVFFYFWRIWKQKNENLSENEACEKWIKVKMSVLSFIWEFFIW